MIKLELNAEEQEMLIKILTSYRSDLRLEIADTERMALRDDLKKEEVFINKVLDILSS